jgi:hypothetical protein
VTPAATTTPVADLLTWAHLDFLVTLGALLAAVSTGVGVWRNLVIMTRLLRRLDQQEAREPGKPPGPPGSLT